MPVNTVLIADDDLGFVCWLGQILHRVGIQTLPARNGLEAIDLLREIPVRVDAVVINPAVPGAAAVVAQLRSTQEDVAVVGVMESADEHAFALPGEVVSLPRPLRLDDEWVACWVQGIYRVLGFECAVPAA
jgi:CheY-like chemotaxis protein